MESQQHSIYHKYWVNKKPINPQKTNFYGNFSFSQTQHASSSTIYKCRKISKQLQDDPSNFYAMKVISFKKGKKPSKAIYKQNSKNYHQIKTQFTVLSMLKKCHRVAKLEQMINQNTKRTDDNQFFHNFLGKPQNKGENYVCFVTQYCNQGNLDSFVSKRKGGLSEEQVVSYGAQIIEGLIELKKRKIIHRDLRLCNILINNNQIKFSDFDTAFIGGYSNYLDVKNGIDNNTAPKEIIDLSSMSDQELKKSDSDKLYHLQQKSDIYFFGLALYKMIFGFNCSEMTQENLINEINSKIVNQKFNKQLLEIMKECLEQNSDKRMDLITLIENFSAIQKQKFYEERTIDKLYLSQIPNIFVLNLNSQFDQQIQKMDDRYKTLTSHLNVIQDLDFDTQLHKSTNYHCTKKSRQIVNQQNIEDLQQLWQKKIKQKKQDEANFIQLMEKFIKSISIRTFYYQFLYSVLLSINMRSIKIKTMNHLIRTSKMKLQKQITNVLKFLFQLFLQQPFKINKYYCKQNLPYQTRKLFETIINSDIFQNKKDCYSGKSKQYQKDESKTAKIIKMFQNFEYEQQYSFQKIYQNYQKTVQQIDRILKYMLKDAIIKLGFGYENIDSNKQVGNIKEILLILIILQQQDLTKLKMNQIIVLWRQLDPIFNETIELERYEVQIFLRQHKKCNPQIQTQANLQKNIVSATFFSMSENRDQCKNFKQQNQDDYDQQQKKFKYNINHANSIKMNNSDQPMKISVSDISYQDNSIQQRIQTNFELALNCNVKDKILVESEKQNFP